MLASLRDFGIYLETQVGAMATLAGAKALGWPPGEQPGSLIYRLPTQPGARASLFAQEQRIRVAEGEAAVVLRDGSLVGAMDPGTYRVEKARVVGNLDVIWIKTGPRQLRWGAGNIICQDGIALGASGSVSVRVADPAVFNRTLVQGALVLPESELQRCVLPQIQGVLRSVLARGEARQMIAERDVFANAVTGALSEVLLASGLAITAFEVVDFQLPAEYQAAISSRATTAARGEGTLLQAQIDARARMVAGQADAAIRLMAGQADVEAMTLLRNAGIDPMAREAMQVLKTFAETPSVGLLGGDDAKAGLIGSVLAASLGQGLSTPMPAGYADAAAVPAQLPAPVQLATPSQAPQNTRESIESQIDGLVERVARGEISEDMYNRLTARLEEKLNQLEQNGA